MAGSMDFSTIFERSLTQNVDNLVLFTQRSIFLVASKVDLSTASETVNSGFAGHDLPRYPTFAIKLRRAAVPRLPIAVTRVLDRLLCYYVATPLPSNTIGLTALGPGAYTFCVVGERTYAKVVEIELRDGMLDSHGRYLFGVKGTNVTGRDPAKLALSYANVTNPEGGQDEAEALRRWDDMNRRTERAEGGDGGATAGGRS